MWILTVFGSVFAGFIAASAVGALSLAAMRVQVWRGRARVGLLLCVAIAASLWGLTATRVEFAYTYAWSSLASLVVAVALPGLVGGLFFVPGPSSSTRSPTALRVLLVIVLAVVLAAILAVIPACGLDAQCDP